ncbi:hypothetical protein AKJ09_05415 [Labilithrix luteola]|uniref:Uncharacterized protein n=1 Tax=Labilithrix luteola TaxID=1391654 RepID=A0A0K1PZF0_9BACT|nr:hypothetical protein AKJ09_05415 [Labilithrix luteola]
MMLAACGSSGGESGDAPGTDTGSANETTADAACQHLFRVSEERCAKEISAETVAATRTRYVTNCVAELALTGTSRSTANVESCARALEKLPCGTVAEFVPECTTKAGTVADGAACNAGAQCKSGICDYGDPDAKSTCGVCATPLAEGASCSPKSSVCTPGTVCVGSLDAVTLTTCKRVSYAEPKAPCGANVLCQPGYLCFKSSADDPTPTCNPRFAPGVYCGDDDDVCDEASFCEKMTNKCASRPKEGEACDVQHPCPKGLGCSKTTGQCAPFTFAAPGESCGGNVGCVQGVCGQGTGTQTCPPIVEDGSGCLEGAHMTCRAPATCTSGKCVMPTTGVCR